MNIVWIVLGLALVYFVAKNNPNIGEELRKALQGLIEGFQKYADDAEIKKLLPALIVAIENAQKDNRWDFMEIVSVITLIIRIQQRIDWINKQNSSEPEPEPKPNRKWAIIGGVCTRTDDEWQKMKDIGFTHAWSFHPEYNTKFLGQCRRVGMKYIIMNPTKEFIVEHRNDEAVGGYWFGSHHEPDILGYNEGHKIEDRIRNYKMVRDNDPDILNHPVFLLMDDTKHSEGNYPGWKEGYTDKDHDILVIDSYPFLKGHTYEWMMARAKNFLMTYAKEDVFMPNLQAMYGKSGQYEFIYPDIEKQYREIHSWYGNKFSGAMFYLWGPGAEETGPAEDERLASQCKRVCEIIKQ